LPDVTYRVRLVDAGTEESATGKQLMEAGLLVTLAEKDSSEIVRITLES
jgi:hypothetical protein